MAWTTHGHQIPGTTVELPEPTSRARCGGPRLCGKCSIESNTIFENPSPLPSQIPDNVIADRERRDEFTDLATSMLSYDTTSALVYATLANAYRPSN